MGKSGCNNLLRVGIKNVVARAGTAFVAAGLASVWKIFDGRLLITRRTINFSLFKG